MNLLGGLNPKARPNRKVGFKVSWSHYRVGDVIEPPGTLRSFLVDNGYAVAVPAETPCGVGKYNPNAPKVTKLRYAHRQMSAK